MNQWRQQRFKTKFPVKLLVLLLIIGFVAVVIFVYDGKSYFRSERIKFLLTTNSNWAPFVIIFLNAVRPFTLVPASALSVPAGAVFGAWAGGLYTMIGQVLAALIGFSMARYFARDYVEDFLRRKLKNKLAIFNQIQKQGNFKTIVFLRLLPVVPFDVISYGAGLSQMNLGEYFLATIVAVIPGSFIYAYLGSTLPDWRSGRFVFPLTIIVLLTLAASCYYYFKWVKTKKKKGN